MLTLSQFTYPGKDGRLESRVKAGGTRTGVVFALHSLIPPETPCLLRPHSGFWPPTASPTVPVRAPGSAPPLQAASDPNFAAKVTVGVELEGLAVVLNENQAVFAATAKDLGSFSWLTHKIITGSAQPIRAKVRRYSPKERHTLSAEVDALLEAGIIIPSTSPWRSNPLLVPKPDGTERLCIDYRPVNELTVADAYPMHRTDDIFASLGQARYFTVIDLKSGFHQIPLEEADAAKTTFYTPAGAFQYTRMPFGLKNAPATFQRIMDKVLLACGSFTRVYLDDVIVFSTGDRAHVGHVAQVLQTLLQSGLKANLKKCRFAIMECEYLGHVVSEDVVRPDPHKLTAIQQILPLTDISSIRSFLGLTGYYRRFVKGYAAIAHPLNELLQKDRAFVWTQECQAAFEELKHKLLNDAVLHQVHWDKPFLVQTDYSGKALGAVLSQTIDGVERPISLQSRSLTPGEKNYNAAEGEALAAIWAISIFRPYVHGSEFTIETDCQSLTWLKRLQEPSPKLARWLIKLSEYDYTIRHRAGKKNGNADALSRHPVLGDVNDPDCMERPVLPWESLHCQPAENCDISENLASPPLEFFFLEEHDLGEDASSIGREH